MGTGMKRLRKKRNEATEEQERNDREGNKNETKKHDWNDSHGNRNETIEKGTGMEQQRRE